MTSNIPFWLVETHSYWNKEWPEWPQSSVSPSSLILTPLYNGGWAMAVLMYSRSSSFSWIIYLSLLGYLYFWGPFHGLVKHRLWWVINDLLSLSDHCTWTSVAGYACIHESLLHRFTIAQRTLRPILGFISFCLASETASADAPSKIRNNDRVVFIVLHMFL